MTDDERNEAHALAKIYVNRLDGLMSPTQVGDPVKDYVAGYATACSAKRWAIDYELHEYAKLEVSYLEIESQLEAERARAAKLVEKLKRVTAWQTDHHIRRLVETALAEYEESK